MTGSSDSRPTRLKPRQRKLKRKKQLSRFQDACLEMSRAFALASSSDLAKSVKDEVGFLQAVRAAMAKTSAKGKLSSRAKKLCDRTTCQQGCRRRRNRRYIEGFRYQDPGYFHPVR
ncbi:DUF3387 domain-containing protein [Yangia mangrovi]|uniref:DUF3387 domain-containing protein n=1 Tax=Alloyangia mangrovi TaxID=1779329 RepID=A0ABT2KR10_9RHOB|nr:DUF3387 domain-containing protein [Alloyangia mangrovi]